MINKIIIITLIRLLVNDTIFSLRHSSRYYNPIFYSALVLNHTTLTIDQPPISSYVYSHKTDYGGGGGE